MIFQGCYFKNVVVAGYVEAFGIVQLENQASYMGYLFRNRCTSSIKLGFLRVTLTVPLQQRSKTKSVAVTIM